jgi:protein-tyrosine phosphatase
MAHYWHSRHEQGRIPISLWRNFRKFKQNVRMLYRMDTLPVRVCLKKFSCFWVMSEVLSSGGRPKSVLFVCVGNSCRSPVCAGVCRQICPALIVESAGICPDSPGGPATSLTVQVCSENGVDISGHRCREFAEGDWLRYSVIAALNPRILGWLERRSPPGATASLALFAPPDGIADPWGGGLGRYRAMFRAVRERIEPFLNENGLADWIVKRVSQCYGRC